jgi:hypothetical protein
MSFTETFCEVRNIHDANDSQYKHVISLIDWKFVVRLLFYLMLSTWRVLLFDLLKSLYSDTKILLKYFPSLQKRL